MRNAKNLSLDSYFQYSCPIFLYHIRQKQRETDRQIGTLTNIELENRGETRKGKKTPLIFEDGITQDNIWFFYVDIFHKSQLFNKDSVSEHIFMYKP